MAYTRIAADGHVTSGETDALPETEEMSTVPAAKIAHSHNLTASTAECPLCSMLDRDRIDARAVLAARAQNLHMLTDKYIHQLENGTLGYDELGEWTDRLLEAGDDWSSHQSAVTNAEWRYRNAITVHSDLAAARRCETEEMSEVPEPDTTATPIRGRVYRITAYNADQGGCHDVDPASLPEDFLDYLTNAASAAHHDMGVDASQYIPVAVVRSILTKWETDYKEFRDFLAGRGLNPDGAACAIFAIKEIRDDINKLTTTEEAPNA